MSSSYSAMNLGWSQRSTALDLEGIADHVLDEDSDLIVLTESSNKAKIAELLQLLNREENRDYESLVGGKMGYDHVVMLYDRNKYDIVEHATSVPGKYHAVTVCNNDADVVETFFGVHLPYVKHRQQATELFADALFDAENPIIALGDFNAKPSALAVPLNGFFLANDNDNRITTENGNSFDNAVFSTPDECVDFKVGDFYGSDHKIITVWRD